MRRLGCSILVLCIAAGLLSGMAAAAETKTLPDPVPRIAIVGDSWGMFTWWFRSMQRSLQELGYGRYCEVANESVVGGGKTFQFVNVEQYPPAAQVRAAISQMLEDYPTIDVVMISLGGNDALYGTEYVLPDDPMKKIRMQCPGHPDEHNETLANKIITQDMGNIVDYILAIRPDIRILLTSYDYGADMKRGECSLELQQLGIVAMDIYKQRLAEAKGDRVSFVSSWGLMQYIYGVYDYQIDSENSPIPGTEMEVYPAGYVKPGFDASDYPPLTLPEPDNIWTMPWTKDGEPLNIPGFPDHFSPLDSLLDHNMHLTEEGYYYMAKRIVQRVISGWLDNPKAFEIMPLETGKGAQYQFQVTFSAPVTGVDITDFEVTTATAGAKDLDISQAQVVSVSPSEGFHDVYTVTVDLNPGLKADGTIQEVVHINVLDDDSIVDEEGRPLGGANTAEWTDNGQFTYRGPFAFVDLKKPEEDSFAEVLHYLDVLTKPYLPMINYCVSFDADKLDINGNLSPLVQSLMSDDEINPDTIYLKGNGLLESFELGLLERCVKDPAIDLSARGGITHNIAAAAWDGNLAQIRNDLGGAITPEHDNMVLRVFSGLDSLFAGYMTMGEQNMITVLSVGSIALQSEGVSQFLPGLQFKTVLADNYTLLTNYFGAADKNGDGTIAPNEYADADKDGATNAQEYLYFQCDGLDAFVNAALNPDIKPKPMSHYQLQGSDLRLYVPALLHVNLTTYQWYKDGVALADDTRLSGAATRTLNISGLTADDSGEYSCTYNEGGPDSVDTTFTVTIEVVTELPEGEGEGTLEGEGSPEGSLEGAIEGEPEGSTEGETPQEVDFCATMERIYTTTQSEALAPLLEKLGDDAALINLIRCDIADLNGPFLDTDEPPDGDADMPGPNGMLDGAYELGVLAALINHPDAYAGLPSGQLSGQIAAGVDPYAAVEAYNTNYHLMYDPLESLLPLLPAVVQALADITLTPEQTEQVLELFPDLLSILAGYATFGDDDSVNVVLFLTTALKDVLSNLALPTTPEELVRLDGILGPNGDADGDGFTNREEYDVFAAMKKGGKGAADYVSAALDPEKNPDHPEGQLNFCNIMEHIYATTQSEALAPLLEKLGDDAALINLIHCDIADLNGPFQDTDTPPDGDADMPGPNGMLDGAYELGVIAKLINAPEEYQGLVSGTLPGQVAAGVDAAAVAAAFDANYHAMYDPLESLLPLLPAVVQALADITLTPDQTDQVLELFPNLLKVLAGYATLGDADSVNVVLFLTTALKDVLSNLALPTTPEELQTLNGILGPDGDADGDGYTNRQEYEFFAGVKTASDYVSAALNPSVKPGATEGEGEGIATEGEGEGIATEGEGEGIATEGEGEGVAPEGEGEGITSEGEGEGWFEEGVHSADENGDGRIALTELLRVIQFFNMGGYSCAATPEASEDGYLPGNGANKSCRPHSSDYAPQNWQISLTELLRLIQFFNMNGYHECPGASTEDGYCPGL